MKVFRLNEKAETPKIKEGSTCFDIKACLDFGNKIRFFNPLNKETYTPVKSVNGKIGVQLYPQQRMLIPTGIQFNIPKNNVLKIYSLQELVFKKGVNLANGVEIINSSYDGELFVLVQNLSDAVAVIEDGESIAQAMLEKVTSYDITDATKIPTEAVEETSET